MRIAYFLDAVENVGGAGNLLLRQAYVMSSIHDVYVVLPSINGGIINKDYVSICNKFKMRYFHISYKTSFEFYTVDIFDALRNVDDLVLLLQNNEIDFVHSTQINIAVEMATRIVDIPHLMNVYQIREQDFLIAFGDIYPKYHLCDSELYSKLWTQGLQLTSRCIRPLAPENIKVKKTHNDHEYNILVLGRLCKRKNQLLAIKMIEELKDEYNLKLTLAGELVEEYAEDCVKYVRDHGLQGDIKFEGFVSDIATLMQNHNILLCCSDDESFPSSIVEGVTYDLTIVTTPAGGICEIFRDQYNAFVAEGFGLDEISASIRRCIYAYEHETINEIHDGAHLVWERYFSRNAIRRDIDEYYSQINETKNHQCIDYNFIAKVYTTMGRMISIDKFCINFRDRAAYFTGILEVLQKKTILIWGAGFLGEISARVLKELSKCVLYGFIDRKKTGELMGVPVFRPDIIEEHKVDSIVIAFSADKYDVIKYLNEYGYKLNENIFLFS